MTILPNVTDEASAVRHDVPNGVSGGNPPVVRSPCDQDPAVVASPAAQPEGQSLLGRTRAAIAAAELEGFSPRAKLSALLARARDAGRAFRRAAVAVNPARKQDLARDVPIGRFGTALGGLVVPAADAALAAVPPNPESAGIAVKPAQNLVGRVSATAAHSSRVVSPFVNPAQVRARLEAAEASASWFVSVGAEDAVRELREHCGAVLLGPGAAKRAELRDPTRVEDVLGSDETRHALIGLAHRGGNPVVLLWGPPGTGKSTLARAFARLHHELNDSSMFASNQAILELSAARSPDLAIDAIEGWLGNQLYSTALIVNEADRLLGDQRRILDVLAGERGPLPGAVVFTTTYDPTAPRDTNRNLLTFDPQFVSRCTLLRVDPLPPAVLAEHLRRLAEADGVSLPQATLDAIAVTGRGREALKALDAHLARLAGARIGRAGAERQP